MRKGLLVLLGLAAIPVASASAADMAMKAAPPVPFPAAYNWTGFYVGGQFGGGWANQQITDVTGTTSFPAGFVHNPVHYSGPLGGFYAGYNYQINQFVVGIDGDFSFADLTGTQTDVSRINGNVQHHSSAIDWVSTATGRVGYAVGDWLWFAKGGWAWARFHSNALETNPAGALVDQSSSSDTRDGWTVGGGIEWGFAAHWSAKLEYDYVKFDTANFNATSVNLATGAISFSPKSATSYLNILKGGVSYRF